MSSPALSQNTVADAQGSRIEEVNQDEIEATGEKESLARENDGPPRASRPRRVPFLPNQAVRRRRRGIDYTQEYPPDEVGGQMGPNARVWRVYLDEADEYDAEMMESFKDTTDVLLVFVGLFSAVVTTFVSQASQALQPDYAQVTASLMTELVGLQRAIAAGIPISNIPSSQLSFGNAYTTTTSVDHWVNGLWFTSLSLSLVAALLAVLVKQWLQYYISALSGTPRDRVLIHHFRFMGLQTWKVPEIIGALPVLLHIALFMFLAGLVIFVRAVDLAAGSVVLFLTIICFTFYFISNILVVFFPNCSYKTPVLSYIWQGLRWIRTSRNGYIPYNKTHKRSFHFFGTVERDTAKEDMDDVLFSAIKWLHSVSTDPSATTVAVEAFAGVPFNLAWRDPGSHLISDIDCYQRETDYLDEKVSTERKEIAILSLWHSQHQSYRSEYRTISLLTQSSPVIRSLGIIRVDPLPANPHEVLANLISDGHFLPPSLWTSLFEYGVYPLQRSASLRLLVLLLQVFREASIFKDGLTAGKGDQANWELPSSIQLVELCMREKRMPGIILNFAWGYLLDGSPMHAIRPQLGSLKAPTFKPLLEFVHAVLNQLETRLAVTSSIQDYLINIETALLSSSTDRWCEPLFINALHRCITLLQTIPTPANQPCRLYHRSPVPDSPALIMLYILDVLQHPWPLIRDADFTDAFQVYSLLEQLFTQQERDAFRTLIDNNGLAVFRRCWPSDFKRLSFPGEYPTQSAILRIFLIPYLDFVSKSLLSGDPDAQLHMNVIRQPDNLAWLLWSSHCADQGYLSLRSEFVQLTLSNLLHLLPIGQTNWLEAAKLLAEELRKDAALFGAVALDFPTVRATLDTLGLGAEFEFKLYGYVSPSYYSYEFKRVSATEEGNSADPMYGPYAVIYEPPVPPKLPTPEPLKTLYQRIRIGFRRIIKTGNDLEQGTGL